MKRKHVLVALCALLLVLFAGCDSAHEHDFGSWKETKEATCEKEGKEVRKCDCGEEETRKTEKLEHDFGEWSVEEKATCQQAGEEVRECKECGEKESKEIAAGEHEYEMTETPATCQGVGKKTYICKVCNDSYEEVLAQTSYSSTEIYNMYLGSVGEVLTYDKNGKGIALGSCFVYAADGKVITNYHVIEDAYYVEVNLGETTYDVQKVLAYDKDIDVAVLQITATDLTPVSVCEKSHAVGSTVYAFGNSQGLTSTFSDGMVTYSDRELDGVHYVQHDAPISGGNSGGPLINAYGEVIGINTWTVRDSQNLNFAISMTELKNLDYSNPMTMAELYDKESNAYKKIANYVESNGTVDNEDGYYYLELDYFYSDDYSSRYSFFIMYYPVAEEILLCFMDSAEYYVYFILTESVSGSYSWNYFDKNNYKMAGTVYAATFSDSSLLSYSSNNITNSSLRASVCSLATSMMQLLCAWMDEGLSGAGVTAQDLGFRNY